MRNEFDRHAEVLNFPESAAVYSAFYGTQCFFTFNAETVFISVDSPTCYYYILIFTVILPVFIIKYALEILEIGI